MGRLIEKWFGFSQIREELEARIGELENENAELLRENENLAVNIRGLETLTINYGKKTTSYS
ncbi:hypothetical protein JT108_04970 [Helicobacter pylori]|nr:hypothetical protein [Helicobacter pylori]MCQ2946370.1 hypothetical protein [Helicobacter pylori]